MATSTSGINFTGLASGIDTNSIISQLMSLETAPIQRLQTQQVQLKNIQNAYSQFKSNLQSLNTSLSSFSTPGAFKSYAATSSNTDLLDATTSANAVEGIYDVIVHQLASSQKVSSSAFADTTSDLNLSGTFTVNSKDVTVTATDSLSDIAKKINDAKAGVTASVINGGTNKAYLSITSQTSGSEGSVSFAESGTGFNSGSLLSKLGLGDHLKTATSTQFSLPGVTDPNQTLDSALGLTGHSYEFSINGKSFTIDPQTTTLNSLLADINSTSGLTASISVVSGKSVLTMGPTTGDLVVTDTTGFLKDAGALMGATELVAAQDADVEIDGVHVSSSSNTLTDVISGVTLNLKDADAAKTVKVAVTPNTDATVTNVKSFMDSFNRITDFINQNSQFDATTFQSGVLFGDNVASQIQGSLNTSLFGSIANLSTQFNNLTQLGFSMDDTGKLTLDEAKLKDALTNDPDAVANVFRPAGRSANSDIQFVYGGNMSKASGAGGYDINITQAATKSTLTANTAQTTGNRGGELLTFTGSGMGPNGYQIAITSGKSLQDTVDAINSDAKLSDLMEASIVSGKLTLTSKRYGAASEIKVTSNYAAASDTSGIGTTGEATSVKGLDVAGTINGEDASGNGQFLVGKSGNDTTDGLQLQYTGTATGHVGSMIYTKGITGPIQNSVNTFIDGTSGLIVMTSKSLDDQIADLDKRISDIQTRAQSKQEELKAKFNAMESAMQAAQAQMARLSAIQKG